jgi:hypothetical protein
MATTIGAFLAAVGVVFCQSIRPDSTTNMLVRLTVYAVLVVFLIATPACAVLTVVLLGFLLVELIGVVGHRIKTGERRTRRPTRAKSHPLVAETAEVLVEGSSHSASTAADEKVIPIQRKAV